MPADDDEIWIGVALLHGARFITVMSRYCCSQTGGGNWGHADSRVEAAYLYCKANNLLETADGD